MIQQVPSFSELLTTPFANGVNALCWNRTLPGDYAEVVRQLGPGEGVVALDEDRLRGLKPTAYGLQAVSQMLADLALLREAGRDPVLNIIYDYLRDEEGGLIATDVLSWHVDSAPVEADTWLCTYHGAPSEGLMTKDALRKVDDPKIRARLLAEFGGPDGESFQSWLTENHYDLHYTPRPGSEGYSFGVGHLWRITVEWPGNSPSSAIRHPSSASPPCVHRAPETNAPRLLLIS